MLYIYIYLTLLSPVPRTALTRRCPNSSHHLCRSKISLIQQFLQFQDITVVISDIDTVWTRNPMPFFKRFPHADVLTSTGGLSLAFSCAVLWSCGWLFKKTLRARMEEQRGGGPPFSQHPHAPSMALGQITCR